MSSSNYPYKWSCNSIKKKWQHCLTNNDFRQKRKSNKTEQTTKTWTKEAFYFTLLERKYIWRNAFQCIIILVSHWGLLLWVFVVFYNCMCDRRFCFSACLKWLLRYLYVIPNRYTQLFSTVIQFSAPIRNNRTKSKTNDTTIYIQNTNTRYERNEHRTRFRLLHF